MAKVARRSRPKPVKSVASLPIVTIMLLMAAAAFPLVESSNLTQVTPGLQVTTGVNNQESDVSEDPWTDYRLPRDLVPTRYRVRLHPNFTTSTFKGDVVIVLKVIREVDQVIFHAVNLNIKQIVALRVPKVSMQENDSYISIVDHGPIDKLEMYFVQFDRNLTIGTGIDVVVKYSGTIERRAFGLYKSLSRFSSPKRAMINTDMGFFDARRVFPCMDEPALKAAFSVSIIREPQYISLSNTPIKSTKPAHQHCPNCVEDFYHDTPVMSTFLMAVAICDHSNISAYTTNGTLIRVFAEEEFINVAKYTLDHAVKCFDYFTEYFDFQLPMSKYDFLGAFKHPGATANWGLTVIRDSILRYSQRSQRSMLIHDELIANQVASQWLGVVVTAPWWTDFWLNKGLATYLVSKSLAQALSNITFDLDSEKMNMQSYIMKTALWPSEKDETLNIEVTSRKDVSKSASELAYDKGASLIWMLDAVLGAETVKKTFRIYIRQNEYKNAQPNDLWNAFKKVSGVEDLSSMESWVVLPGHPVVTLTRRDCLLIATQKRFLLYQHERKHKSCSDYNSPPWLIPFTFITSDDVSITKHFWMKYRSQVERNHCLNSTTWIKGNVGRAGLYRVNYDEDNWALLAQQLVENHSVFSEAERYQLLEDVFLFARVGMVRYSTAFGMLRYLEKEKSATVWIMVVGHLKYLLNKLRLEEEYRLLQAYIWDLVQPKLEELGWGTSGDSATIKLQDQLIYLAKPNQTYTDMLLGIYAAWRENPTVRIAENIRDRALRAALAQRTVSIEEVDAVVDAAKLYGQHCLERYGYWEAAFQHSFEDFAEGTGLEVETTNESLLYDGLKEDALNTSCSPTVWSALTALGSSEDFDVLSRMVERYSLPEAQINPSLLLAGALVKQHWKTCVSRNTSNDCGYFVPLKYLDDKFDYDEVIRIFERKYWDNKEYRKSLEELLSNIKWNETNMADLKTWLKVKMRTWALNEENFYPFPV